MTNIIKKTSTIRFRILLSIVIPSLIMTIIVGSISLGSSRSIIKGYAEENLLARVREQAYRFEHELLRDLDSETERALRQIKMYETGYLSLLNSNYEFIIHPVLTKEDNLRSIDGGQLSPIVERMEQQKEGVVTYTYHGEEKILGFFRLSNGYTLTGNIDSDEVFYSLNQVTNVLIMLILIGLLITVLIAAYISKRIGMPIVKTTDLINKTAELNLREDNSYIELTKSKDETGVMVRALSSMRGLLRNLAIDLKGKADRVSTYSQNLSDIMDETSVSVQEVASASDELARGAQEQSMNAQEGLEKLHGLASKINIALENSKNIEGYIDEIVQASDEGTKSMDGLKLAIIESSEIAEAVNIEVEALDNKSTDINKITSTIKAVADQTNLLALNAAIEAARAGEQGRGFGVVAEEIRKLSNEVDINVKEIENIVTQIRTNIVSTKDKVLNAKEVTGKINDAAKISENSMEHIREAIASIIERINILTSNVASIDEDKNSVVLSMEGISAISQQAAASTEEVSASFQQQTSSIEEIVNTSHELSEIARELENMIEKFTV